MCFQAMGCTHHSRYIHTSKCSYIFLAILLSYNRRCQITHFIVFPLNYEGGKASIEVREMSKIALERCTTAKEAVLLMGSLAEQYGFYAADWSGGDASKGEGGEALTVVDKTEAWVFHVLADDTGTSAVWAAQRVKDDHVSHHTTTP